MIKLRRKAHFNLNLSHSMCYCWLNDLYDNFRILEYNYVYFLFYLLSIM